jgi:hypothetical protein
VPRRLDRLDADGTGRALEAVRSAEQRLEQSRSRLRLFLQRQEITLKRPQVIFQFAEERRHQPLGQAVGVHARPLLYRGR